MGCASSKLDDLEAVALCRERCTFLDEAIHQRYALAAAHMAYINSLKSIGHSLHLFIQQEHPFAATSPPSSSPSTPSPSHNPHPHPPPPSSSSKNHLPKQPHPRASPSHSHSLSNPDSHLVFDSDDEDDDDDDDDLPSLHHSGLSSPLHLPTASYDNNYSDDQLSFPPPTGPGYLHMNYMKNKPPSSLVYQQRPVNNDTVHVGESSSSPSSSSFYPYPYPSNPYPYDPYTTPYAGGPPGYYASPSFYGSSSSQRPPLAASSSSSSKPPPPPPSPPRTSAWDFLNFFDNSEDKYYPQYTPSRDSRDVREEEGIPDLEDEEYQHEVVKQVHGDQKLVDAMDGAAANHSKAPQDDQLNNAEPSLYQTRPRVSADNDGLEYDVHVVDKKVVDDDDGRSKERGGAAAFPGRAGSRDAFQVAKEIEAQFQIASDSGTEIAKILEVGKLPYNRKHGAYQASSKMLHVPSPSMSMVSSQTSSSTSKSAESTSTSTSTSTVDRAGPGNLDFEVDLAVRSRNLSSTLQKLYLWEKKLYNEVKAEEKMRLMHDKKIRKLKRLDERGADFQKVDSTRALIRSLSTKIRMAIQVVDKISVTINKIRDEELWPQLRELIQGLTRMWKSMLECHRSQSQAIREARILGSVGSRKKRGDSHLLATKQLEQELINWTFQFSSWISAQKGYVRALNNWLMKCLSQEPEETADGIVPFSPGRIGAPPIFVICNQWSQALDRIAEKEVVDSMHVFTMSVLQIWEQDKLEMHRQMMENKDLERIVKNIDRDDQKLQKQFQALERKIVLGSGEGKGLSVSENIIYQSDKSSSLQASLQRIFEAMEKFTNESVRAYEELLQRNEEEESAARGH